MSIIPGGSPSNLPMFRITCDGVALPATADLISLETMQSASGDATTTLRFVAVAADRAWSTLPAHAPLGAWLEIALGYGTQVGPVFAGRVRAHRLSVAAAGLPERVLEAASTSTPVARRGDGRGRRSTAPRCSRSRLRASWTTRRAWRPCCKGRRRSSERQRRGRAPG